MVERSAQYGSQWIKLLAFWVLFSLTALELPDTLQSWFLVLHLHIWMCLVRLKAEGKDGRYMYKTLVRMMWLDVEERIDNLGTIDSVQKRDTLLVLQQQFNGLSIGYDEGLLCDDRVLATVLWRNLFQNKNRTDAEQLGRLVEYVRKNIQHLDSLPTEHVLQDGRITWLPLNEQFEEGDKEDNDWFGLTFWSSDLQAVDWISTNTTFNWFFFVKLIQFDLSLRSNLKSLVYSSKFYLRIVGVVFSFTLTLKKLSRPRNSDAILLGSKLCFRRMKFVTWYLNTVGYPRKPNELLKR